MSRNTDDLLDSISRIRSMIDEVAIECDHINKQIQKYISEKHTGAQRVEIHTAIWDLKHKLKMWAATIESYGITEMIPTCWGKMKKSFDVLKKNEQALRGNKKARRLNQALHNPPNDNRR